MVVAVDTEIRNDVYYNKHGSQTIFGRKVRLRSQIIPSSIRLVNTSSKALAYIQKQDLHKKGQEVKDWHAILEKQTDKGKSIVEDEEVPEDTGSQRYRFEQAKIHALALLNELSSYLRTMVVDQYSRNFEVEDILAITVDSLKIGASFEKRDWQTSAYSESEHRNQQSNTSSGNSNLNKSQIQPPRLNLTTPEGTPSLVEAKTGDKLSALPSLRQSLTKERRWSNKRSSDSESSTGSIGGRSKRSSVHEKYIPLFTIHFSLLSKACEEAGWIIREYGEAEELEKRNLIGFVHKKLTLQIENKKEEMKHAEVIGATKEFRMEYWNPKKNKYGHEDSKRVLSAPPENRFLLPFPIMPDVSYSSSGQFITTLPDETTIVKYFSGNIAIVSTRRQSEAKGLFTQVYDDSGSLMAIFTADGTSTVYHTNGLVRVLTNCKGGTVYSKEGDVTMKFKWPEFANKMLKPLVISINTNLMIKYSNINAIYISFSQRSKRFRMNAGKLFEVDTKALPEENSLKCTFITFTSAAANELLASKKFRKKQLARKKQKLVKTNLALEELKGSFELASGIKYDIAPVKEQSSLKNKTEMLLNRWIEHYRCAFGDNTATFANFLLQPKKVRSFSARSTPSRIENFHSEQRTKSGRFRAFSRLGLTLSALRRKRIPSAPAIRIESPDKADNEDDENNEEKNLISKSIDNPLQLSKAHSSRQSSRRALTDRTPKTEMKARILRTPINSGCPVGVRLKTYECHCSNFKIPKVTDEEYFEFVENFVQKGQLLVVAVYSSEDKECADGQDMLNKLYTKMNVNRTKPCRQCFADQFRLVRYDLASACKNLTKLTPLLLANHNVRAGTFMFYYNGKLVFADQIFNGYSGAKRDLLKQIGRSLSDGMNGKYLPNDFKLSFLPLLPEQRRFEYDYDPITHYNIIKDNNMGNPPHHQIAVL